jgi:hypothetical protein
MRGMLLTDASLQAGFQDARQDGSGAMTRLSRVAASLWPAEAMNWMVRAVSLTREGCLQAASTSVVGEEITPALDEPSAALEDACAYRKFEGRWRVSDTAKPYRPNQQKNLCATMAIKASQIANLSLLYPDSRMNRF